MPDTDESLGQDMLGKASDELPVGEGHELAFAIVPVVLPGEGDMGVGEGLDAMVADGDLVCPVRKYFLTGWVYLPKYSITLLGPAKGLLAWATQSLENSPSYKDRRPSSLSLSSATDLALNTLPGAFTGYRDSLFLPAFVAPPLPSTPTPGTIQCRCGCRDRFCPHYVRNDYIL